MKRQALSIAALMLFAPAVHAADLGWNSGTSPMYSAAPASSWEGFYAGVNAGYGWGTLTRQPTGGGVRTEDNSGGWQFGYRYAIVTLPWMFLILLESAKKKISILEWAAYGFSFAANIYATWIFHWTKYLTL